MIVDPELKRGDMMNITTNRLSGKLFRSLRQKFHKEEPQRIKELFQKNKISQNYQELAENLEKVSTRFYSEQELDLLEKRLINSQCSYDDVVNAIFDDPSSVFCIYYKNIDIFEAYPPKKVFAPVLELYSVQFHLDIAKIIEEHNELIGISSLKNVINHADSTYDERMVSAMRGADALEQLDNITSEEKMNINNGPIDELTKDSFFDDDLAVDSKGNTVSQDDYSVKSSKITDKGDTLIAAALKQSVSSFVPGANSAIYALEYFTGFNLYGPVNKQGLFNFENRLDKTKLTTTNLDENIIYKCLPDLIMFVTRFIKNDKVRIAGSVAPLLFELIANFKERKNPLVFNSESNEIDIEHLLVLLIPIAKELLFTVGAKHLNIDTESFNLLGSAAQSLWGVATNRQNNVTSRNSEYYNPNAASMNRNIKQPRYM